MSNRKARRLLLTILVAILLLAVLFLRSAYKSIEQVRIEKAFFAAVRRNDDATVLTLLKDGADPNVREPLDTNESLWQAVWNRLQGKQPEPKRGELVLMAALEWEHYTSYKADGPPDNVTLVNALLERGANPDVEDERGMPAIFRAMYNRRDTFLAMLRHTRKINTRDKAGRTPLMESLDQGDPILIKALLDKGADVNAQDGEGNTALMTAVAFDDPGFVKFLLDKHPNTRLKDSHGNTALSLAKQLETPDILELLRKYEVSNGH